MRITKVVTKTGDNGTTGLSDKSRVSKASAPICAIGDIDELNCCIGLILPHCTVGVVLGGEIVEYAGHHELKRIQHDLFSLGGEISFINSPPEIPVYCTKELEDFISEWTDKLPPLENFILPNGSELVCRIHHARSVCRRAERSIISMECWGGDVSNDAKAFINRLSDFLFVLARVHSEDEILWDQQKNES